MSKRGKKNGSVGRFRVLPEKSGSTLGSTPSRGRRSFRHFNTVASASAAAALAAAAAVAVLAAVRVAAETLARAAATAAEPRS